MLFRFLHYCSFKFNYFIICKYLAEEKILANRVTILCFYRAANAGDASAAPPAPGAGASRRLAQQQAQIDEVVDIMKENIDKVLERDKNLSQLDDRAGI